MNLIIEYKLNKRPQIIVLYNLLCGVNIMKTVYYTVGYDKKLHETNNIIYLKVGEFITLHEVHYEVVWKLFNATNNIMIYHFNPT